MPKVSGCIHQVMSCKDWARRDEQTLISMAALVFPLVVHARRSAVRSCVPFVLWYANLNRQIVQAKSFALPLTRRPIMRPKRPKTLEKISITRTLTNRLASEASARAALLPLIPTLIPQIMLQKPTVSPAQNKAYPV